MFRKTNVDVDSMPRSINIVIIIIILLTLHCRECHCALLLVFIFVDQHTAVWIVYGVVPFHLHAISPTLQQKSACRFAYSACALPFWPSAFDPVSVYHAKL